MFSKQLLHSSFIRLSLIAVVLCSITLLGARSTGQAKAASQSSLSRQAERLETIMVSSTPNNMQEAKSFTCTDLSIAANIDANLVVVFCGNRPPEGDFFQFVVRSDSKWASRVTAMVLTAMASSKSVGITYNLTPSTLPSCDPANCRELLWLGYSG